MANCRLANCPSRQPRHLPDQHAGQSNEAFGSVRIACFLRNEMQQLCRLTAAERKEYRQPRLAKKRYAPARQLPYSSQGAVMPGRKDQRCADSRR